MYLTQSPHFWVRMSGVRFVHVPFLPLCLLLKRINRSSTKYQHSLHQLSVTEPKSQTRMTASTQKYNKFWIRRCLCHCVIFAQFFTPLLLHYPHNLMDNGTHVPGLNGTWWYLRHISGDILLHTCVWKFLLHVPKRQVTFSVQYSAEKWTLGCVISSQWHTFFSLIPSPTVVIFN